MELVGLLNQLIELNHSVDYAVIFYCCSHYFDLIYVAKGLLCCCWCCCCAILLLNLVLFSICKQLICVCLVLCFLLFLLLLLLLLLLFFTQSNGINLISIIFVQNQIIPRKTLWKITEKKYNCCCCFACFIDMINPLLLTCLQLVIS